MDRKGLTHYAQDLRKNNTDAEKHLWSLLRANRLDYKFKKQVSLGQYESSL